MIFSIILLDLLKYVGYHPWFTHWICLKTGLSKEAHYGSLFLENDSKPDIVDACNKLIPYLPEPIPLDTILAELRQNLSEFPNAMLGEVGLDRACRVPYMAPSPPPYVEHDNRRELSPFTIPLSHQLAILEAQLDIAVGMRRNVSCHSVKSQQATADLLIRMKNKHGQVAWEAISIDLHSCGFSTQSWLDVEVRTFITLLMVSAPCLRSITSEATYQCLPFVVNSDQFSFPRSQGPHCFVCSTSDTG